MSLGYFAKIRMSAEFSYYSVIVDCFNASDDAPSDKSEYYHGDDEVKHCEDDAEDFVAVCKVVVDKFFHCFVSLSLRVYSLSLSLHTLYHRGVSLSRGLVKVFLFFFRFVKCAQKREKYFLKFCSFCLLTKC